MKVLAYICQRKFDVEKINLIEVIAYDSGIRVTAVRPTLGAASFQFSKESDLDEAVNLNYLI